MLLDRLRSAPHHVAIETGTGWTQAQAGAQAWAANGVEVSWKAGQVAVQARGDLRGIRLRWTLPVPSAWRFLGDAWERGYGDLEWRGLVGERTMPWYVLIHDGVDLHGLGVATGAGSFAAWRIDADGVTLELDCRCGGEAVQLGARRLIAADIIVHCGSGGDEHAQARAFCQALCPAPRLPGQIVYGVNDWYYAYGRNDRAGLLRDADQLAQWSDGLKPRPHQVIDMGWGVGRIAADVVESMTASHDAYGDLRDLATAISARGVIPGIWLRPLEVPEGTRHAALLRAPHGARILDPSTAEGSAIVAAQIRFLVACGYHCLKHDFTTFDCFGRWGFQMGASVTADGWAFADRGRTSAEIIRDLYVTIREAAGDALILGCNTVGHLAAGLEELQRTGDDTSGRFWERTRKMGPNTLAMRMPQHGTFFVADADCVGLTDKIPWERNRAWLEALAASGTALFVSPDPVALGPDQHQALRQAFALAASGPNPAVALDWRDGTAPTRWRTDQGERTWRWNEPFGAEPITPP